MTNVMQLQIRVSCIVIIASLHHISHNIVTIHLILGNSHGEVCDEAETIYYTFGPEKAQEMGFSGCKVEVNKRRFSRNAHSE